MQPTNIQGLGQNKFELEGEIRLLERSKNSLQNEISRIQKLKDQEFVQYSREITTLKEERDALIVQIGTLNKDADKIIQSKNDNIAGAKEFNEGIIAQIKTDLDTKQLELAKKDAEIEGKQKALDQRQETLEAEQDEFIIMYEQLVFFCQELDKRSILIDIQATDIEKVEAEHAAKLKKAQVQLVQLNSGILTKQGELKALEETWSRRTQAIEESKAKTRQALADAERLKAEFESKLKHLDTTEKSLKVKEIQLNDRQGVLERAFNELRSKGGNIDA